MVACMLMPGPFLCGSANGPINLAGVWERNHELSSPPGGMPTPGDGERTRRAPAGGGSGGGARGRGFGGIGGGRPGEPGGGRPSPEDLERQRAIVQEVMELPARLTITQDGEKVMFVEPDGVVRTYVANGKTEKHQLTSGTIETKSSWDGGSLRMEIRVGGRAKLIRTFGVRDDPRRLEVTTAFDGAPKETRRLMVYDEMRPQSPR
jgi:hypothetical protein